MNCKRIAFIVLLFISRAPATVDVIGTCYRADEPFPEFAPFWTERSPVVEGVDDAVSASSTRELNLGGSVHIFLRNTGSRPSGIEDVELAGISLKRAIAFSEQRKNRKPANVCFSNLNDAERKRIIAAGEPIWWRVDPQSIPPGGICEITVRLRARPTVAPAITLLRKEAPTRVTVTADSAAPRFAGISFGPDLRDVFLYAKHPEPGCKPAGVRLDGQDVTAAARIGTDPKLDVAAIVLRLPDALSAGSLHCFHVQYTDGTAAIAGIRAWSDELGYGVWGGQPGDESETAVARRYVDNLSEHNVNLQMPQVGSRALAAFFKSSAGQQHCRNAGLRFVIGELDKWNVSKPFAYFLHDEPDAGDAHITGLPTGHEVGSLAQWAIGRSQEWRAAHPAVPQALNVDLTYKPHNWYVYGQVPDILMADPYYQPRLRTAYWEHPERIPLYRQARFVYAISRLAQSAAAPKPAHIILYANRYIDRKTGREFRYPTPVEKRIEVYYALAGGAKGISYWWFSPGRPAYGLGGKGPEAARLWREVGLLGAEVRTAGPVIVRSCPANVPVQAPQGTLASCLLAGLDTMVVVIVNEQHLNDDKGAMITPLPQSEVAVHVPYWMRAQEVFEVRATGPTPVPSQADESQLRWKLGTLDLPRLFVVTGDAGLRGRLDELYRSRFASNVAKLLASE